MAELDREKLEIIENEIKTLKEQYENANPDTRKEILIRLSVLEWVHYLLITDKQKVVPRKQQEKPDNSLQDLLDRTRRPRPKKRNATWPDFTFGDPFDKDKFRDPFTPRPKRKRGGGPFDPDFGGGSLMCSSRPTNFDQVLKREMDNR